MKSTFTFLLLLMSVASQLAAQTYEVQLDKAEVRLTPTGAAIGSLLKGARVEGLEKQGNWLKFRMEGWIYLPSIKQVAAAPGTPAPAASGYVDVSPEDLVADPSRFLGKKVRIVGIKFYGYQPESAENVKLSLGTEGVGFMPASELEQLRDLQLYEKLTVRGEILDVIGNSLYFMRVDRIEK